MSNNDPTPQNPYDPNNGEVPLHKAQDAPQEHSRQPDEEQPLNSSTNPQTGAQSAYSIPLGSPDPAYQGQQYQQGVYQAPQYGQVAARHVDMTVSYAWLFFLGTLGAHKFYMGNNKAGAIYLIATILSAILTIAGIGFLLVIAILFMIYSDIRTMPEQVDEANAGYQNPDLFIWFKKAFNGGASPNRKP